MFWGLVLVVGGVILLAAIVSHVRGTPSQQIYRDSGPTSERANPRPGGGGSHQ
jgi:hypothetical protein